MLTGYNFLQQSLKDAVRATKKYIHKKFLNKRREDSSFKNSGRGAVGLRNRAYGFHWIKGRNHG